MTGVAVPIPPMPSWVRLVWTRTNAVLLVLCDRCETTHALYATVLKREPEQLAAAVEEHWGCKA